MTSILYGFLTKFYKYLRKESMNADLNMNRNNDNYDHQKKKTKI